jgi:hypothetical protein
MKKSEPKLSSDFVFLGLAPGTGLLGYKLHQLRMSKLLRSGLFIEQRPTAS